MPGGNVEPEETAQKGEHIPTQNFWANTNYLMLQRSSRRRNAFSEIERSPFSSRGVSLLTAKKTNRKAGGETTPFLLADCCLSISTADSLI